MPFRAALFCSTAAAAIVSPITGAFVTASVPSGTSLTASGVVPLSAVFAGSASMFDNTNDRVVAPAGSAWGRAYAHINVAANGETVLRMNGSTSYVGVSVGNSQDEDLGSWNLATSILALTAGDYFDLYSNLASVTDDTGMVCLEVFPYVPRYSLFKLASNFSVTSAWGKVSWNGADITDADGMHDPSGSPTIFTIPAGGPHLVRVRAQGRATNSGGAGEHYWGLIKSDESGWAQGGFLQQSQNSLATDRIMHGCSAIMTLASGTQWGIIFSSFGGGTGTLKVDPCTFCEVEILPATTKYTFIRADGVDRSHAVDARLLYSVTQANTAGMTVPGDGRIIVPVGSPYTQARLVANALSSSTGFNIYPRLNGTYNNAGRRGSNTDSGDSANLETVWFAIAPGDTIDVAVNALAALTMSGDVTLAWICVEFR